MYAHTLLVSLVLVALGIYLLRKPNVLIFALASLFHLVLDEMWLTPQTLFWPLYGWGFPKEDISHWWQSMFQELLTNPWMYLSEIIGALILVRFGAILVKKGMAGEFLLKGISP